MVLFVLPMCKGHGVYHYWHGGHGRGSFFDARCSLTEVRRYGFLVVAELHWFMFALCRVLVNHENARAFLVFVP